MATSHSIGKTLIIVESSSDEKIKSELEVEKRCKFFPGVTLEARIGS